VECGGLTPLFTPKFCSGSNCRAESLIKSLARCGEPLNPFCLKAVTLNVIPTCELIVLIEVGSDWIVE
jgi:hypothetical protein